MPFPSMADIAGLLRRPLLLYATVAAAYGLCSQLSYSWFNANGASASFFPAAGVTLAALVLTARPRWPVVLAAAATAELTVDTIHGIDLQPTLGYVAANTVEPLVGALLLVTYLPRVDLARARHLWAFFVCAVAAGPLVGATIGASTFVLLADGNGWGRFLSEWWVGDGLGVLVVGGALLSLRSTTLRPEGPRVVESVLLGVSCVTATFAVFWFEWFSLVYLPIVLLLGIALRAGTKAVALTGGVVAFVAAEATAEGHVFWQSLDVSAETGVLYLQLSLAIVIASTLVLAAEIGERDRSAVAWATAEAARRAASSAARRAERLRSLAEELSRASSEAEVIETLARHEVGSAEGDADDRLLNEYAARMTHGALERARLLEREREARSRAELLERNAAHLAAAATARDVALSTVSDLRDAGFEHLALFVPREGRIRALASFGLTAQTLRRIEGHTLDAQLAVAETMRTGETLSFASRDDYDARYPSAPLPTWTRILESRVAVPLFDTEDRVIGALFAASAEKAGIDERKAHVLAGVAKQCGLALDRAALFETERDVSRELQLGLMGGELIHVEGTVMSAEYRPGTEALDVGGDWHDAFLRPNGSLALVVGDVVGHGLEAAVTMSQLRGAVRALAVTGTPLTVMERLDAFVETLPAAEMATVAYMELEPGSGRIRYACAGHPPPLIVSADGSTRFLWDGRSAPLGSILGHARSEAAESLADGETVVLYTDGLVERRGESLDVGLKRLAAAAASRPPGWTKLVTDVCDELLRDQLQDDDVCVLTLHRAAREAMFRHTFSAAPSELAPLRQKLGAWLRAAGVEQEAEWGAVLAVSEAAANAVEHGYAFDGRGTVTVEARLDDSGQLHLSVYDQGTWRERVPDPDRGRGRLIMESVMASVEVERNGGTVVRMRRPAKEVVQA